ncbi:hypothetical protein GGU10DRAFT_367832 [Lentinula aff. detonsa]|uniref:Uncharacterized protein n=1 Tax=Lentinula aff. detonsa TaxID=2804958 RepID=A0AA38KL28_9AGAR|nr:hypothetical protein GGU10DRAFT_367832 [Lentinula aff. detonsa]
MYQRLRSRNTNSSHYSHFTSFLKCLLFATVIGACIASPVPSGGELEISSDLSSTAHESFIRSQVGHWYERRGVKDLKNKVKKKLNIGGKKDEEKKDEEVDDGENVVLGYTYHDDDENFTKAHPRSRKSTTTGRTALERLENIVSVMHKTEYSYFFPGPNYYNKFVSRGYHQAKTMVSLSHFDDVSFAYIPMTTTLEEHSLKEAAENSWRRKVTSGKDGKVEVEERTGKPNFSNTILIVELARSRYAMLVPKAVIDSIPGGLDPKVDSHDMPAATWQNWEKIKELGVAKTFIYTE